MLLHVFCNGQHPSVAILEGKLPHAVELRFQWHGDLRAGLPDGGDDLLDAVDFDEERQGAARRRFRQRRIIFCDSFLIVEKDFERRRG